MSIATSWVMAREKWERNGKTWYFFVIFFYRRIVIFSIRDYLISVCSCTGRIYAMTLSMTDRWVDSFYLRSRIVWKKRNQKSQIRKKRETNPYTHIMSISLEKLLEDYMQQCNLWDNISELHDYCLILSENNIFIRFFLAFFPFSL